MEPSFYDEVMMLYNKYLSIEIILLQVWVLPSINCLNGK